MASIELLCGIDGVSGSEAFVRNYLLRELRSAKTKTDSIGNLYVFLDGKHPDKTVIVTAHIDEAGFIISGVTDEGALKFKPVGNIDPRTIVSKKLRIGKSKIPGIIGMKAIHLQKKSERESTAPMKELFIDIGAGSKKAALKLVNIGDYAAFDTDIEPIGKMYKGKALDRVCALCVLNAANTAKPLYNTIVVFTAQRHVGARGAKSIREKADIALNIGVKEACDIFGAKPHEKHVRLGEGAVISYGDRYLLTDRSFSDRLYEAAVSKGISVQKSAGNKDMNITGAVQTGFGGRLCAGIDIPIRYPNTPAGLVSLSDIGAAERLLNAFLENTGEYINGIVE